MSSHEYAVIVAKVLTVITTITLRVSLIPDFIRWRKNQNTGDMSAMPCVLLYTNSYALLHYGYAIDDMLPLFAASILGVIMGGIMTNYFYQWTVYKRYFKNHHRVFYCMYHSDRVWLPSPIW
ncbi:Sugar efflux transporter for intercellular exchange [Phytophthora infestans]|uniref:Sugar efflux transporter for intercellular exchange n=1 Tax=Phytophthora infestans TaxID=4787 RepID=A0A8S9TYL9_PHYIN|nr:Sugar efflux transporter for intercellular exchange [Phytophthora infestans]